jgi:hypothetical protein
MSPRTTPQRSPSPSLDAFSAIIAVNLVGLPTAYKKFTTVGIDQRFTPVWNAKKGVSPVRAEWCTDIGGPSGGVKTFIAKEGGLTEVEASLVWKNDDAKDKDNVACWKNHSHVHDRHDLGMRLVYKVKGDAIVHEGRSWGTSDFMEGAGLSQYRIFFDTAQTHDDGKFRGTAQADDKFTPKTDARLNGAMTKGWVLHWAKNTYDPCMNCFDLLSTDPMFIYDGALSAYGEYKIATNRVHIGPKMAGGAVGVGFSRTGRFVNSDMKRNSAEIVIDPYVVNGVLSFNKIVNHELAHWDAMKHRWDGGQEWIKAYGDRRLKPKVLHTYTLAKSSELKVTAVPATSDPADAIVKYAATITTSVATITVARGWLMSGTYKAKEKTISGSFTLISEHGAATVSGEATDANGLIIEHMGDVVTVSGRANDPDDDYIPSVVEDALGLNYNAFTTFGDFYHPLHNDREVWAEYSTRKISELECTKERDWANPGMQTR